MGAQEIEAKVKGAQAHGDDFLKEFAMAFKEGDWSIGFCQRVIGFLGLRNDNNFSLAPRVEVKSK